MKVNGDGEATHRQVRKTFLTSHQCEGLDYPMMPKGVERRGFLPRKYLPLVLNAFRHHRNSHSDMDQAMLFINCAQRLSASSEFSHRQDGVFSYC
jgi:hypothetical protein